MRYVTMATTGVLLAALALVSRSSFAQSTTATGVSNAFNPAISVNALLLGEAADASVERAYNQIDLQEAEVQLTSIVDPYWKANLVFAVHPAEESAGEEHAGYEVDVEAAYVDGTALPWGLGLRVGKDYLPFGKHAALHTHQFPFVRPPLAVSAFLGELSEVGARVSREIPLPWYVEATVYAVDGRTEIFAGDDRDLAWGGRWTNVWDLGDEATVEVGGSYLHGPRSPEYPAFAGDAAAAGGDLAVWGADVTCKWISAARTKGPALTVTGEVVVPEVDGTDNAPLGWYALAQYRFAPNWWAGVGAGGADLDLPAPAADDPPAGLFAWQDAREYKANLTWVPSEFSAVRLEAARYDDLVGDGDDWLFSAQVNVTIGSHPAHLY